MSIREVLHEVLSDFTSSSLQNLKWSVSISVHWIISQLQTADIHKVMEFLQKSSEECSDLTMMILEYGGVASEVPTAKSTGYTWKLFLETQRSLTSDEYSAFLSMLEDELEHIWKRKLEEVDQSQVVQLLEKLFCQDPIVLSLILEEMCSLNLIHVSPESSVSKGGASDVFRKLSHKEFEKLRPHLKYYLPHISLNELEETGRDDIVGLMKTNSNRSCVELTEKVLKRMERPDLVSKLSQQNSALTGPWPVYEQGPWSDESEGSFVKNRMQHVKTTMIRVTTPVPAKPLHYKMMWSNLSLLLNLSEVSWQNFQKTLPDLLNVRRRGFPVDLLPREAVLWVVLQHGLQSLYKAAHVLVHMGLSGLAQQLFHSDTEARGFLWSRGTGDWHKISKVLANLEVLLDTTVYELSYREMSHFEWFVQFTCLEEGVSWIDLECERQSQEFEMMASACTPLTAKEACAALMRAVVVKHGQRAAGFMKQVFMNMNRDDLIRRLWHTYPVKQQFEMGPALYKKIKEMEAVINRLMKMFGGLNTSELMDLKHALTTGEHSTVLWYRLCHYETSHLVFSIVQTYGQRSVELTKNLLESIGRIDRLTWLDSGSWDYSPYDWWYALINKVATVAAVTELLGETLSLLRSEELKRFKKLLVLETLFHPPPHVDLRLLASANAEQTAALLLHTYGLKAVKTTFWILKKMRCSDVARNLQSKMTTGEPSKPKVATVKDLRKILLKLLAGLSDEEMCKFKMRLQLRYCRMDHAWLQEREADADGLVDLIFETSGQRCLQVITDVLEQMGKRDLVIDSLEGTGLEWFLDYTDSYTDIVSLLKENSKASADVERVQVVLQELTDKQEEQTFKKHLQISCESNLSRRFVWNYIRIFSEPQDLMDLLVAVYGEFSSADVIQTVLSDMGRQDLMAKMSKPSVTSEGLGQRVEPDSWISAKDIWTKLEPKVQEINSQFTYSLQSDKGQYECSVSGLRWSCEQSVSFQYRFGPWEEHLERLKERQYMPAGPLIDITVSSGRLDVVYLPHWVCVDNPDTEEKMAVLHINDSGDTLEKATKVTSSHVKLLEPVFSPRAVLIKLGLPVKIYCSLLIYKTNTAFLTLHVYLIPRDPGLKESMDRSKQHGYSIIPKPHPDRSLKFGDQFVLKSHQETLEIIPQKLTLRYQIPPNFYEVYTKNPDFDFKLELAQLNDVAPVWSCTVRQGEYTERKLAVPRPEGIHFVDKFELELIQRVSNIAEILDHLLRAEVVGPEAYDTISILSTSQQKMRELFRGPLKSSGERGKDIFYTILKDKESYLCAELEGL